MRKITYIALSAIFIFPAFSSFAFDERSVFNPKGQEVFKARFFGVGDGFYLPLNPTLGRESTWNIDERQKKTILSAMSYWAEIIQPAAKASPAIINFGTDADKGARAFPYVAMESGDTTFITTLLAKSLQGVAISPEEFSGRLEHGMVSIGTSPWDTLDYMPSQLPRSPQFDLYATIFHEIAHNLGVASLEKDTQDQAKPLFYKVLTLWELHLRDDNGNPAQPSQKVQCAICLHPNDAHIFDARKEQAYFTGTHVDEVLAGAFGEAAPGKPRGVPVKLLMFDRSGIEYMLAMLAEAEDSIGYSMFLDKPSHIELKNSMMSHQKYRNTTTFMEAELAVMQDLGYTIDRRHFYGYSVYGDGQTMTNRHGFFQRDANGTSYLPGQYNTATLGMGLHIYGSQNTITQEADLLSQGAGGAGVRIDGVGNTLIVAPNTKIHANGIHGRGVMVAYGKNHTLIHRGDIQATGADGIAANFDFGNNMLGNVNEYRGSYIRTLPTETETELGPESWLPLLLGELDGPLVRQFDVTGSLTGQSAAIYMSDNALVGQINIMRGAQLVGDILSRYKERDEQGQPRLTQLTFGQLANAQGQSTGQTDANFALYYQGNIQGTNLALTAQGGVTALNGEHQLYSVNIAPGATLAGNSSYTINEASNLTNQGTLSPGNSIGQIAIAGNYQQTARGQLLIEVDGAGHHDVLKIDGVADLDGQLTVAPQRDWYANQWNAAVLQANTLRGTFANTIDLANSPTLRWTATPTNSGSYRLTMLRAPNAYSQYAQDANSQQLGAVLDRQTNVARADMQGLYRTLDFSAADGSVISAALRQLTPEMYSTLLTQNLEREHQISDLISARAFLSPFASSVETEELGVWRGFASAFGGKSKQNQKNTMMAYSASNFGAVFGAEKQSADHPNWIWGFHGAASTQTVNSDTSYAAKGEATAFHLGLHTRYAADPLNGPYLFGHGRVGIASDKMERAIHIQDYSDNHQANWTSWNGSLLLGGGYRWAVNEALSIGPIATLDYTLLARPGVNESGRDTSISLASQRFHSLRSSLGAQANAQLGTTLKAHMTISWDRAHLSDTLTQDASLMAYQNTGFQTKNAVTWRDALRVQAGLTHQANKKLTLGAHVSSHFFRAGYQDVNGSLFMTRRF